MLQHSGLQDGASAASRANGSAQAHPLRSPTSAGAQGCDFGWRLQGKSVGVLPERSFKLVPAERLAQGVLDPYWGNLTALQACLQCGTCTANCSLAGEHSHFPRRQMNLFQLGQYKGLLDDPLAWHCYNCGDCSNRCPSGAKPGKLMGAIRQMAVEHFAFPSFVARSVNRPQRWWLMFAVAAALVLGVIAVGGSFRPAQRVEYASMLPHLPLNVFFSAVTGLALLAMGIGASRAWAAYQGGPLWQANPRALFGGAGSRIPRGAGPPTVLRLRCPSRASFAHLGMFYGFLGLAGLAGVAALLMAAGGQYPFPALHPLKVIGNLAAGLMILGTAYFSYQRWIAARNGESSTYFDWLLLANLLLVGITGVLCEAFRYWNVPLAAYPGYFLHLVSVFVLFVSSPYSKMAHVCFRIVALTSRQYDVLLVADPTGSAEGDLPLGKLAPSAMGDLRAAALACYPAIGKPARASA